MDQSGVNQRIYELLDKTDIDDVTQLAKAGAQLPVDYRHTPFQPELENAIREAYAQLPPMTNASFCGALLRHRRRYAGRFLRRSAGNLPQRSGF
ncbi:PEP/pyruvate-binding domain-containing protein [Shigella flexneri]